jgi:hypothetical protein
VGKKRGQSGVLVFMRPGAGVLIFGIVLLVGGVAVTLFSNRVVWYGAILVGIINIVRGGLALSRSR